MLLVTSQITERSMGGGPIGWVSDYVSYEDVNFGTAIQTLEVQVRSNPALSDKKLPRLRSRGLLEGKQTAPRVTFRRKDKTLRIKWMTQHLTDDEMEQHGNQNATIDTFSRAVHDVVDALDWGLAQRLTPKDDFDVAGCLAWVRNANDLDEQNDEAFRRTLKDRSEIYVKRSRTLYLHAKIKTDWASLHPDAAHLLHHPDLWNETDARMPQGNPLGQGILTHFDYYAALTLEDVLKTFATPSYDEATDDKDKTKALQIELGLVFAHIKKRGTVAQDLADALVKRMAAESQVDKSFWVHRSRIGTNSHFHWMYNHLEAFTKVPRPKFHKG